MTERTDITELYDALRDALLGQEWRAQANCRGLNPDLFFPGRGRNLDVREAKAVCAGCTVRKECEAVGRKEKFGIWGGTSERERKRFLRKSA